MVRIINAFREDRPVGAMLARMGDALFGDQATGEINRQQAYALQRGNVETDNLMALARDGGLETLTPAAQAMLIGSGYDPNDLGRIGTMGAATQFGARDPRTTNWSAGIGEYGKTAEAFDFDQANQRGMNDADNAAAMARQNALPLEALDANGNPVFTTNGGTAGYQPILSNTDRQGTLAGQLFPDMNPGQQAAYLGAEPQVETIRGPTGAPTIVSRTDAIGQPAAVGLDTVRGGVAQDALAAEGGLAALDPATATFVGADPAAGGGGTPRTYLTPDGRTGTTLDGVTDAMTREALPPGTIPYTSTVQATNPAEVAGVTTPLYRALYAAEDAYSIGEALLTTIDEANPEAFGLAGTVANLARGVVNTVGNLGGLVGLDLNSATLQAWALGESPNLSSTMAQALFGPDFNETQRLAGLYVYQVAGVLSGQTGQDLSDKDVQAAWAVTGDPRAFGMNQATFRAGVAAAQEQIRSRIAVTRQRLGLDGAAAPAATPAPTVVPGAGAPRPGWTQEEWNALTPEERATLTGGAP